MIDPDRIFLGVLALAIGGFGGAVALEGTLGRRAVERERAANPDRVVCGGVGVTPYLAGGFLLGAIPTGWLLVRFGAFRGTDRKD